MSIDQTPTPHSRDLWRLYLRDLRAQLRRERAYRQIMAEYPGKPASGTQLRTVSGGKKRLVLVRL